MDDMLPVIPSDQTSAARIDWADVERALLAGRKPLTLAAYSDDLRHLQRHLGAASSTDTIRQVLDQGQAQAHLILLQWMHRMEADHLAPATINRRLSAVRALADVARILGRIDWHLEIRSLPARAYRDTTGPGHEGVRRLLDAARTRAQPYAARDVALIWLLYGRGLRIGEVLALDLADVDPERERLRILGKGRREPEWVTIPRQAVAALTAWIAERSHSLIGSAHPDQAAIFIALDTQSRGARLTAHGARHALAALSERAGIPRARPHGLRHAAITAVLDRTQDPRTAQRFSRHKRLDVVLIYDDNREDLGGQAAAAIANGLEESAVTETPGPA